MESDCVICGRVKWGRWVQLPFGKWRHDECELGSEMWQHYYSNLSAAERKPLDEFHKFTYTQTLEEYNATA